MVTVHDEIEISEHHQIGKYSMLTDYQFHPGMTEGTYFITPELAEEVWMHLNIRPEEKFQQVEIYEE